MHLPDLEITTPPPILPAEDWASISLKGAPPLFIKDGRDYFSEGMHLALDNALQQGGFSTFNKMLSFFAQERSSLQKDLSVEFKERIENEFCLCNSVRNILKNTCIDLFSSTQWRLNLADIKNVFIEPSKEAFFLSVVSCDDTRLDKEIRCKNIDVINENLKVLVNKGELTVYDYYLFSDRLGTLFYNASFTYFDRNLWIIKVSPAIESIEDEILKSSFDPLRWENFLYEIKRSIKLIQEAGNILPHKQISDLLEPLNKSNVDKIMDGLDLKVYLFGKTREATKGEWVTPLSSYWKEHANEIKKYFSRDNVSDLATVLKHGREEIQLTTYVGDPKNNSLRFVHTNPEKFPIIKLVLEDIFQDIISSNEIALSDIANMHWLSANAMFFERGSASINQLMSAYLMTVFGKGKFKPAAWKKMPDFMALITTQEEFVEAFINSEYGGFKINS